MSTLEDRILGEKLHYYCSSSSSSENEDNDDEHEEASKNVTSASKTEMPLMNNWEGTSINTGPKGVLKDWQRFKQLEAEQRKEQEKEKIALAKKLVLTCRSHLDDEKLERKEENCDQLLDDEILQRYIVSRMEEMMKNISKTKAFGNLLRLNSKSDFLEAIDNEEKNVVVIVHLFDKKVSGCEAMNGCLISVAQDYPEVKFCCIEAAVAGLSINFQGAGLPALLVYKGGQMVGNFVRLTDELGDDYYASDVESFLIEHGILHDKSMVASVIKDSASANGAGNSD